MVPFCVDIKYSKLIQPASFPRVLPQTPSIRSTQSQKHCSFATSPQLMHRSQRQQPAYTPLNSVSPHSSAQWLLHPVARKSPQVSQLPRRGVPTRHRLLSASESVHSRLGSGGLWELDFAQFTCRKSAGSNTKNRVRNHLLGRKATIRIPDRIPWYL